MKIIAVIPTFNEAAHIKQIVSNAMLSCDAVIVADDSSPDGTARFALEAGALVTMPYNPESKGVGANTLRGIGRALNMDADIIVTLDGDGQHNPAEIPAVVKPIETGEADFVIGNRFANGSAPSARMFGIRLINCAMNFGHKQKLQDTQSGFRAFNRACVHSIWWLSNGFGFSVESIIKARARKWRIKEVPISCIYNGASDHSKMPLFHGIEVILSVLKWRFYYEILKK